MAKKLTEDQIEREVEWRTDYLDRMFMAGKIAQSQYDEESAEVAAWAAKQYDAAH